MQVVRSAVRMAGRLVGLQLRERLRLLADARGVARSADGGAVSARAVHRRRVFVGPPAPAARHPALYLVRHIPRRSVTRSGGARARSVQPSAVSPARCLGARLCAHCGYNHRVHTPQHIHHSDNRRALFPYIPTFFRIETASFLETLIMNCKSVIYNTSICN